ncbi:MAG: zinc ribbon domain-containing protein [Deltaproteobacteria bacterium]|nr:zinc ribbon domain-containing protein [Deltaproteobacteria bacterium]MBW1946383.1 zinc ribbon domain-containing protein [Deltaproteobacteria bacterium]MBW1966509.1 zinc ribbon domain-containing protein [Deltaproteobacteria bacterium]MBW2098601.1 zinc ribbon domain-containing protein [Deltaproteobacteria bacterium]
MPIYEYVCTACGENFEELVLGSGTDIKCPKCGALGAQKKVSAFAFKSGHKFAGTGKKSSGLCTGCTSSDCRSCGI